jgi:hypothetical protein
MGNVSNCINFPDLEWFNFQKNNRIILNIDLPATKTDTIKTKIEIAYVYDLAHACYKLSAASIIDMLSRANKCKKIMSISMSFDWKHSRVISHVELI